MSFPRDAYPYTNFHELNLGYFIVHFREIFSQWADLYDQMTDWKDATDAELATWKAGVEADLDQREAALKAELETWKAQTGQDIAGWEDATLAALTAWQTATQAVFEAIRVEAAGSASAAAASAGDAATAKTAAETAQAAAEAAAASVQASAAQITTNTEDIAELKTQLSYAVSATPGRITTDIFPLETWTDGYVTTGGTESDSPTGYYHTNKIHVSAGDKFTIDTTGGKTIRFVTAYTGNVVSSSDGATYVGADGYTVPEGIDGVIITLQKDYGTIALYYEYTGYTYKNVLDDDIEEINNNIEEIDNNIDIIEDKIDAISITGEYKEEEVTHITPTFSPGYMSVAGIVSAHASYHYTQKIAVTEGQVVGITTTDGSPNMRFVCAFSGNTAVPAKGKSSDTRTYIVPAGIDGVVITCYVESTDTIINVTELIEKESTHIKKIPFGYMSDSDSLSDREFLILPACNSKNYNRLIFNARVSSFDSLIIEKAGHSFTFDNTNIVLVGYGLTPSITIPHGLTIADTISILIENDNEENTSLIRISSNGQEFSYTGAFEYRIGQGAWKATSDGSVFAGATLAWTSKVVNSELWLFGDSYFSFYNTRWTYYAIRDGFGDNCMFNGFSGAKSVDCLEGLKNLLNITVPKIVVWCMGMNDPDTNGVVSSAWLSAYNTLVNLSIQYGFEIVLYTPPTTPIADNSYKNAIIKASGYRYIDADAAVRIDGTRNWISGALADDDLHPTVAGAKIIYYKVLADLPEIMSRD